MQRCRSLPLLAAALFAFGCGGSSSTGPTTSNNTSGSGSGRTMTATYNGATFAPTLLTSAYLNGAVAVNAADNARSLLIQAVNISGPGTYSLAPGNPNSALGQWIDATGSYSTGYVGGTGSVTLTVVQLGRVAGSFTFTVKNVNAATTVALNGTFDIKFP
jgi:Family of unknown function (DUF6252)